MKKILYILPVVAMLAAGCGSSSSQSSDQNQNTQNENSTQTTSPTPTPSPTETMMQEQSGSAWQGTLMASDNGAKGQYKLTTGKSTIYIKTGRDFSSLVGKNVNVKYNGSVTSFSLVDITAQ